MERMALVFTVVLMLPKSNAMTIEALDELLNSPMMELNNRRNQDTAPAKDLQEIQQKLTQHTQVLEDLIQGNQKNEDLLKKLVEALEHKQLDKVEVFLPNRRSDSPKTIDHVGQNDTPIISVDPRSSSIEQSVVEATESSRDEKHWCFLTKVCQTAYNPVCGRDENYGFGKFDSLCHMIQINCRWGTDFTLTSSCDFVS